MATAPRNRPHEFREAPVRRRNLALQPGLQHAAQNRRSAAGRNRDDERVPVDDRGHDEVAELRPVGDIDQYARALRRRVSSGRAPFVVDRDEAKRRILEVAGLGIARLMAKTGRLSEFAKFVAKHGGERRHPRAGADQVFRPPSGHDPAADDDGGLAVEFEKDRQMAHA